MATRSGAVELWTFPGQHEAASPAKEAADKRIDELFLKVLTRLNAAGVEVTTTMSRAGAPAVLAETPEAKKAHVGKAVLAEAMHRLIASGQLWVKQIRVNNRITGVLKVTS
jgi:hypothetical protein